jgi:hypothetical protein
LAGSPHGLQEKQFPVDPLGAAFSRAQNLRHGSIVRSITGAYFRPSVAQFVQAHPPGGR